MGYEAAAARFIAARSRDIGVVEVLRWARALKPGAAILDLGCGHGEPIARLLIESGFDVYGLDASPTLVAEFRHRFPETPVSCEDARTSRFYGRRFDGILAIGLLFLFCAVEQRELLGKMAAAVAPAGQLLFTAPAMECTWDDAQTGLVSRSLGAAAYHDILVAAGLEPAGEFEDAGGNHYFAARRPGAGGPGHGIVPDPGGGV